jgi:hypothetical protein
VRDVLALPSVDVGNGWLIFGLPPAEVAVHPSNKNDGHELHLMPDDIEAVVAEMRRTTSPVASKRARRTTKRPARARHRKTAKDKARRR